jgi:hypothetical protein
VTGRSPRPRLGEIERQVLTRAVDTAKELLQFKSLSGLSELKRSGRSRFNWLSPVFASPAPFSSTARSEGSTWSSTRIQLSASARAEPESQKTRRRFTYGLRRAAVRGTS